MERAFIWDVRNFCTIFKSPKGETASRFASDFPLFRGGKLTIRYHVTAHEDGGDCHVRIRTPGGTYLRVNIYATAV